MKSNKGPNMNDFYECNHPSKEYITRKLVTEFHSLASKGDASFGSNDSGASNELRTKEI